MTTPASAPLDAVTPEPDAELRELSAMADRFYRRTLGKGRVASFASEVMRVSKITRDYVTSLRSRLEQTKDALVEADRLAEYRTGLIEDAEAELTSLRTELEEANRRAKHAELGFADLQSRYAGKTQFCEGCESLARELEQVRREQWCNNCGSRDIVAASLPTTQDGNK